MSKQFEVESSDNLEALIIGAVGKMTMEQLAHTVSFIYGCKVTYDEPEGPGGIISNIVLHFEEKEEQC